MYLKISLFEVTSVDCIAMMPLGISKPDLEKR